METMDGNGGKQKNTLPSHTRNGNLTMKSGRHSDKKFSDGARSDRPHSDKSSSSTNKQSNMYTQVMNGHRKAVKQKRHKNIHQNYSQNVLLEHTSTSSEKGTVNSVINGRENQLIKSTEPTTKLIPAKLMNINKN